MTEEMHANQSNTKPRKRRIKGFIGRDSDVHPYIEWRAEMTKHVPGLVLNSRIA